MIHLLFIRFSLLIKTGGEYVCNQIPLLFCETKYAHTNSVFINQRQNKKIYNYFYNICMCIPFSKD
jgi:hypothetical protein